MPHHEQRPSDGRVAFSRGRLQPRHGNRILLKLSSALGACGQHCANIYLPDWLADSHQSSLAEGKSHDHLKHEFASRG